MTTPEPVVYTRPHPAAGNGWRDIVQSGADSAQSEGFALEHLIDLQRDRAPEAGEGR